MNLKLSEHRTSLTNLGVTFDALDKLNELIKFYSMDTPGPAYLKIEHGPTSIQRDSHIQIDRNIMVVALKEQRDRLIAYLAKLGIEVDTH